jgi:CDP-diacylglycerol--glycerol-3-phosphate 3-phosphatidyltransferase
MANLITLFRLISVFIISAIALYANSFWQLFNVPFIIINILLDGLDGVVARKRRESSVFGAVFDIAADRIIEITLWIILAQLNLVSIWIAIIFVTRGVLVDSLRKPYADNGKTPFSIMRTTLGRFLVASRAMRFTIGLLKLLTFSWLFFLLPANKIWPQLVTANYILCQTISVILVYASVIISLARGVPVIIEGMIYNNK